MLRLGTATGEDVPTPCGVLLGPPRSLPLPWSVLRDFQRYPEWAGNFLIQLRDLRAVPRLIHLATSRRQPYRTRGFATVLLGYLRDPRAIRALQRLARPGSDDAVWALEDRYHVTPRVQLCRISAARCQRERAPGNADAVARAAYRALRAGQLVRAICLGKRAGKQRGLALRAANDFNIARAYERKRCRPEAARFYGYAVRHTRTRGATFRARCRACLRVRGGCTGCPP